MQGDGDNSYKQQQPSSGSEKASDIGKDSFKQPGEENNETHTEALDAKHLSASEVKTTRWVKFCPYVWFTVFVLCPVLRFLI